MNWGQGYYGPPPGGPMFQLPPNTSMRDIEKFLKILDKIGSKKKQEEDEKKKKEPPKAASLTLGQAFMLFSIVSPIIGIGTAFYVINVITEMAMRLSTLPR